MLRTPGLAACWVTQPDPWGSRGVGQDQVLTPHQQSTQQCWEDVGGQWARQGLCSPGTSVCSLLLAWLPSPTRLPLGACTSPYCPLSCVSAGPAGGDGEASELPCITSVNLLSCSGSLELPYESSDGFFSAKE